MRRLLLIGCLLLVLIACGEGALVEPPAPTAQAVLIAPTPTRIPATATIAPTATIGPMVIDPTPTSPLSLTVSLSQSYELQPRQMPTMLSGWSPDERYLLYVQVSEVVSELNVLAGHPLIYDTQTQTVERITDAPISFAVAAEGMTYDGNLPQWTERCCEIIALFVEGTQQQLKRLDQTGAILEALQTVPRALFLYHNEQISRVEDGTYITPDNERLGPLMSGTGWITSTHLARDGVYSHDGVNIQYLSADTSWIIEGEETFLKDQPTYRIARLTPSFDGSWLAVVTQNGHSLDRELWIINRETQAVQFIDGAHRLSYPRWSFDTTMLAYKIHYTINVFDRTTQRRSVVQTVFRDEPVWHPSRLQFAVINDEKPQIDIFEVRR